MMYTNMLCRRSGAREAAFAAPGFFSTFHGMLLDVHSVSVGPERHAFHMALWLAVFNQVGSRSGLRA